MFDKANLLTGRIVQYLINALPSQTKWRRRKDQRKYSGDTTLISSRGNIVGRGLWRHTVAPASAQNHVIIILRQPFSPVGEESGGDEQTWRQLRALWTAVSTLSRRYLLWIDVFPSGNCRRPPQVFCRSRGIKVPNQKLVILGIAANVSVAILVG